jgi:hypothetical protein
VVSLRWWKSVGAAGAARVDHRATTRRQRLSITLR